MASSHLRASVALPPGKEPLVPLTRMLSGPQNRSGRHEEGKYLVLWGLNPTPWLSCLSQSLTNCSSIGLWRWYIEITIKILYTIHPPVFCLKTRRFGGDCLRLQVEPNRTARTERVCLSPVFGNRVILSIGPIWVGSTWRRRQSSLPKRSVFK
jgi:hypothetical protein